MRSQMQCCSTSQVQHQQRLLLAARLQQVPTHPQLRPSLLVWHLLLVNRLHQQPRSSQHVIRCQQHRIPLQRAHWPAA